MNGLELTIRDPADMTRLGRLLSGSLSTGDVVALEGPLGAGKSVLARAVVQSLCPQEDDIPSPTFMLVQTYEPDSGTPLMHFDLYRLDAPEDALELGIEDAFVDAICLIEWASRLGPLLPRQALRLSIEPASAEAGAERRIVSMSGGARWHPVFAALREAFAAPS